MARLPASLRALDDGLQPFQPLVPAAGLVAAARGPGRGWSAGRQRRHRQHLCSGAPLRQRRKRGAQKQAIGVSRGGRTTKIHLATDLLGRPLALILTPGNPADIRVAGELLAAAGPATRIIADRGYDAEVLRRAIVERGSEPVIPGRRNRKRPVSHDPRACRERWRVEAAINRLKDFRRVATRYDKLAANFQSTVALAAVAAFWI
ncbi:IS5 family transposase [Geminicoccaceae bacterium 1502E]|nr:IS5 family transposase [Geminicoccaceae bacterium 1502E]